MKHVSSRTVPGVARTVWSAGATIAAATQVGTTTGTSHWRAPLREALDWLRDTVNGSFARKAKELFKNPWAARNGYIDVVLDRSRENIQHFLDNQSTRPLNQAESILALKLMELTASPDADVHKLRMVFDELSGIETVQVIQYAGRAIQLAEEIFKQPYEARFIGLLEKAKSNVPQHKDGAVIFEKFVRPAAIDLPKVGAHYAVSSLFEPYNHETKVYCYWVDRRDYKVSHEGKPAWRWGECKSVLRLPGIPRNQFRCAPPWRPQSERGRSTV